MQVDQVVEQLRAGHVFAHVQGDDHGGVFAGRANAVDAAHAGNDDDVASPGEKRRGGTKTETLDFVVDRQVFFDVLVLRHHVGFGLIVVVIRNEEFDAVLREKVAQLAIQLRGKGFVVRHDQRGSLYLLDHRRDGPRFARPRDSEKCLEAGVLLQPLNQVMDGVGLVAGGFVGGLEKELGHPERYGFLCGV